MKVLGSTVFSFFFAVTFIILLARYWKLLHAIPIQFKVLLFSFRTITLTFLLILFINPWVSFKKKEQLPQKVNVIFDHSESVKQHYENQNIQPDNIKTKIINWASKNGVKADFFRLGNKIKSLASLDHYDMVTEFSSMPEFISYQQPEQVILITDGKATVGLELNELKLQNGIPIHILGIGPISSGEDLSIEWVNVSPILILEDTANVLLEMQTHLFEEKRTKLQILNEHGTIIFDSTVSFGAGSHKDEISLSIPAVDFSGLNKAIVHSIEGEKQIDNNIYSFRVNVQSNDDSILLITGALSSNSNKIKRILQTIPAVKVDHCFRFDKMRWNKEPSSLLRANPKMMVLDDFPSEQYDKVLFDEILTQFASNQIPIIYFEGPHSNLSTGELIRSHFPYLVPTAIDSDILTSLSDESSTLGSFGIDLSTLPPQRRSVKWMTDEKTWVNYSDGSLMVAIKNNILFIAAPDIAGNHLKTSNNLTSPISMLIRKAVLHKYYDNDGFLSLYINQTSFNEGESINVKLHPVGNLGLSEFSLLAINANADTIITDCSKMILDGYYSCIQVIQKPGEYTLKGEAMFPDGNKVLSNESQIIVQNINIELKDLTQDQYGLMRVAHKSGGLYMSIESLDSMFSQIEITPVQLIKNHQISGLSSQNFWWILIILLSVEWFVRKKLGLL